MKSDLLDVDHLEEKASKGFISNIKCRIEVWWQFLSDDVKTPLYMGVAFAFYGLIVAVLSGSSTITEFLYYWYIGTAAFCVILCVLALLDLCRNIFNRNGREIKSDLIAIVILSAFATPAMIL